MTASERARAIDYFLSSLDDLSAPVHEPSPVHHLRNAKLKGGDELDWYRYKGVVFVIQQMEKGFEVYIAAPGDIDMAAHMVKRTEELRLEMQRSGIEA